MIPGRLLLRAIRRLILTLGIVKMESLDVLIIGGGLLGWSAAYELVRAGISATVVDRADEGQATAAGAGIIAPGTSVNSPDAFFPLGQAAVAHYPKLLAQLAEDGETTTGYETVGALFIAGNTEEAAFLPAAFDSMRKRRDEGMANIGDLRMIEIAEARQLFPPLADLPGAIHVPGAARVNGRLLRDSLRRAAEKRGAKYLQGDAMPVAENGRVTKVDVSGTSLPVGAVIIAGGAWSNTLGDQIGVRLPVYPQRGQIAHLEFPDIDTSRWPIVIGYHSHYLLTFPEHRVVAGATREQDSGYEVRLTAGGVHEVLSEALRVAPGLATARIVELRIGLRPFSPDKLPIIGRAPGLDNVYLATGHGPAGLQLGPVSSAAVVDLIRGEPPRVDLAAFGAERFGD
jgi:glycine/D-amino acid oxidase-like deaminating enzyme